MRLLIVDDDPVFREEFRDVLDGEGHQVETAASTLDAVARLVPGAFDAVFTDLRMPRFSGFDLLKELRRRAPSSYAVVVTGQADEATALEAMRAGAFDVLGKPFDFAALAEVLGAIEDGRAYRAGFAPFRSTRSVVEELMASDGGVALLATRPVPVEGTVSLEMEAGNPWASMSSVRSFAETHPHGAVVLCVEPGLLAGIGPSPTVTLVAKLRSGLSRGQRLAVGVDGPWLADDVVMSMRCALAAQIVPPNLAPAVLPGLRRLLRTLATGSPENAVVSPGDSSRIGRRTALLMDRLVQVGWASPTSSGSPLTPEGRGVAAFVAEIDARGERTSLGDWMFTIEPEAPATPPRPG